MFNEVYLVNHLCDIFYYSCKWLVFKYSYRCKGPKNAFCFTLKRSCLLLPENKERAHITNHSTFVFIVMRPQNKTIWSHLINV